MVLGHCKGSKEVNTPHIPKPQEWQQQRNTPDSDLNKTGATHTTLLPPSGSGGYEPARPPRGDRAHQTQRALLLNYRHYQFVAAGKHLQSSTVPI